KIDVFCGSYIETELEILFDRLRCTIEKANCVEPVCFSLNSSKHSIMAGYDPKDNKDKLWQLINAGPIRDIPHAQMANEVTMALTKVMGMEAVIQNFEGVPIFCMVYTHDRESQQ